MRAFLSALHAIELRDSELDPEWKFLIACSPILSAIPARVIVANKGRRSFRTLLDGLGITRAFDPLPFGFGRARPVDFSGKNFYLQHATVDELRDYFLLLPGEVAARVRERSPGLVRTILGDRDS
jgi:hypothetical protein